MKNKKLLSFRFLLIAVLLSTGFVALKAAEDENGGGSQMFIPDTEFSVEEIIHRCKKCAEEHGPARSYQYPNYRG